MGSFAPRGHAKVDPQNPAAFAICDQCGFLYNHRDLRPEMQYRGTKIEKTGFLVCNTCWDEPNATLQAVSIPPDPVPVLNPRAEPRTAFARFDMTKYKLSNTRPLTLDMG